MFLSGFVAGVAALFFFLLTTNSLVIRRGMVVQRVQAQQSVAAPARKVASTVPPPPAPARPSATPPVVDEMAIPVADVAADQLRDTYAEARSGGRVHDAIDILAPRGTPVVAAVDGQVVKLFFSKAGGTTVYEFDAKSEYVYYYAHLDAYADGLTEGKIVTRGEVIGYVGTTGNAPPNTPHLHFAISKLLPTHEWWKGDPVDPYPILKEHGVTWRVQR